MTTVGTPPGMEIGGVLLVLMIVLIVVLLVRR
jgi:hypothetical protein